MHLSLTGYGAADFLLEKPLTCRRHCYCHYPLRNFLSCNFDLPRQERRGRRIDSIKPHNVLLTLLGTGLLWFGWFGFNAGSALAANEIATLAFLTTLSHAAAAGLWLDGSGVEPLRTPDCSGLFNRSPGRIGSITPAAGFVTPMAAIPIGLIASVICYTAVGLKGRFGYDDSLDVFGAVSRRNDRRASNWRICNRGILQASFLGTPAN